MNSTDKYLCPDCGGDGDQEIHSAECDYRSRCRSCGGSGKVQVKISLAEYEWLKWRWEKLKTMANVSKITTSETERQIDEIERLGIERFGVEVVGDV